MIEMIASETRERYTQLTGARRGAYAPGPAKSRELQKQQRCRIGVGERAIFNCYGSPH